MYNFFVSKLSKDKIFSKKISISAILFITLLSLGFGNLNVLACDGSYYEGNRNTSNIDSVWICTRDYNKTLWDNLYLQVVILFVFITIIIYISALLYTLLVNKIFKFKLIVLLSSYLFIIFVTGLSLIILLNKLYSNWKQAEQFMPDVLYDSKNTSLLALIIFLYTLTYGVLFWGSFLLLLRHKKNHLKTGNHSD